MNPPPSLPTGTEGEPGRWLMVWSPWLEELLAAAEEIVSDGEGLRRARRRNRRLALTRLETAVRTLRQDGVGP